MIDWAPVLSEWRAGIERGIHWGTSNDAVDDRLPDGVVVYVRNSMGELRVMSNAMSLKIDLLDTPEHSDPDGDDVQVAFPDWRPEPNDLVSPGGCDGRLERLEAKVHAAFDSQRLEPALLEELAAMTAHLEYVRNRAKFLALV